MGQGESLATSADPLVQRQSSCRETGDRKPRQADTRGGRNTWNTPEKKAAAVRLVAAAGLPRPAAAACLHPEERERQETRPSGIPIDEGPRDAGALPAGAGPHRGDDRPTRTPMGFGTERSTADAIDQCFIVLARKSRTAVGAGRRHHAPASTGFSHDWMLAHVPMDKAILQKWLKAGFIDNHVLYPTDEGTPQGGIAAPPTILQNSW